jgi:hypothetical protein
LSPLLFSSTLEHAIRRFWKQVGTRKNGIHYLLVYVDYINLLGDNTDTIKKNAKALIDTSKEVDVKVNTEKTKSCHQNAGQNHDIKII